MEKTIIITIVLIAGALLIRCLIKAFCGQSGSFCCSECGRADGCKNKRISGC